MTASQAQALEDIKRHGNPWYRVRGQSQHGGWNGVMRVIARNRWAKMLGARWLLTEEGQSALKLYAKKRRVKQIVG